MSGSIDPREDRQRALLHALLGQPARTLRHEEEQYHENRGGQCLGAEHPPPAHSYTPGVIVQTPNSRVDEIDHEHAEHDGELIDGHQPSPDIRRGHFGDVERRQHGHHAHAHAADNACNDEFEQIPGQRRSNGGDREQDRRNQQRRLPPKSIAQYARERRADHTADESAGSRPALAEVVQFKSRLQELVRARNHRRIIAEKQRSQRRHHGEQVDVQPAAAS